jgi:hypothetical protein
LDFQPPMVEALSQRAAWEFTSRMRNRKPLSEDFIN